MKLKTIEIKGLFGKYNIEWNLNSSLNILSGINGSGKTTVLDIIAALLIRGRMTDLIERKTEQVIITFEDNSELICVSFRDSLLKLRQKARENDLYLELWNDVTKDLSANKRLSEINQLKINASISYLQRKRKKVPVKPFLDTLKIDIISTFDTTLPASAELSRVDQLHTEGVYTALDWSLYLLQERYAYYLGNLANQVEQQILSKESVNYQEIQHLYQQKQLFFDIIDELYVDTHKRINRESSRLEFITFDEEHKLSVYELSSGEKQLLYIFLTVLMEQGEDYIIFMDEPEISLHIDWQKVLLEHMYRLNPNCQIIMSTHAPYIILHGWKRRVTNIDDIKEKA